MNVLVGMQARLMQPPPIIIGSRSIKATFSFRLPRYIASVLPPFPPPMTMAAYRSASLIVAYLITGLRKTIDADRVGSGARLLPVPKYRRHNLESPLADYCSRLRESERPPPRPIRPCQIDETNWRPRPCSHRAIFRSLWSAVCPRIGRTQN